MYYLGLFLHRKDSVKILVTTGVGKFYSNGLDLDYLKAHESEREQFLNDLVELFWRLMYFPLPTVAAINGNVTKLFMVSILDMVKQHHTYIFYLLQLSCFIEAQLGFLLDFRPLLCRWSFLCIVPWLPSDEVRPRMDIFEWSSDTSPHNWPI